jgi:hypothetical protein
LRSLAAARWASSKAVFSSVAATCKLRSNIPHSCSHTYYLYVISTLIGSNIPMGS